MAETARIGGIGRWLGRHPCTVVGVLSVGAWLLAAAGYLEPPGLLRYLVAPAYLVRVVVVVIWRDLGLQPPSLAAEFALAPLLLAPYVLGDYLLGRWRQPRVGRPA